MSDDRREKSPRRDTCDVASDNGSGERKMTPDELVNFEEEIVQDDGGREPRTTPVPPD